MVFEGSDFFLSEVKLLVRRILGNWWQFSWHKNFFQVPQTDSRFQLVVWVPWLHFRTIMVAWIVQESSQTATISFLVTIIYRALYAPPSAVCTLTSLKLLTAA